MRTASKVFLAVAAVLILAGFVLCGVGKHLAAKDGKELFSQRINEEGRYVTSFDFSGESVSKLHIDVDTADVTVIGGSARSYAELIDFNPAISSIGVQNRSLQIKTGFDLFTFFKIDSGGFSFDGLRDYLRAPLFSGHKQVIVHLSEEDIRAFEIELEKGDLQMEGIDFAADYRIEIEEGDVKTVRLANASSFSAECGKGDVILEETDASRVSLSLAVGHVTAQISSDTSINAETDLGKVTVNGTECGREYRTDGEEEPSRLFDADVDVGDIAITVK